MTKILRELTAAKKTSDITSKQVLTWAKRGRSTDSTKTLMATTKTIRNFMQ